MSKTLNMVAFYSAEKISAQSVPIEHFITVDNLVANKSGKVMSEVEPAGTLTKFRPGDTLVGNIRPYLKKIWLAKHEGGCTQDVLAIRASEIDATFLYYSLFRDDFFAHMMKGAKGTKMPRGDRRHVLGFEIPDLDPKEQKKIAAVLSALDAKIELNNRINRELEALAKTIYDYWFVQFDFPDENGRPYRSSGGKMTYNKTLKREIPSDWEAEKVEEFCRIRNGFAFRSDDYCDSGILIVRTKNFENNSIVLNDVQFISDELARSYSDYKLSQFDLLLVMVGASVGKTVTVPSYLLPALQNQNMWKFQPLDLNYKLFNNFRIIDLVRKQVESAGGSARSFFQKEYFYSLPTFKPSIEIALQFESKVKPIFERVDSCLAENHRLAALRDWLLPMLMNGQVVVAAEDLESKGDGQCPLT